jgi:hypothetical protein
MRALGGAWAPPKIPRPEWPERMSKLLVGSAGGVGHAQHVGGCLEVSATQVARPDMALGALVGVVAQEHEAAGEGCGGVI